MSSWIIISFDVALYFLIGSTVVYLFVFAVASKMKKKKIAVAETSPLKRFVVMFPAYKEDKVIINSVESVLKQDYPKDMFDIVVISDKMKDETNKALSELPIILLNVNFENSSKAKAMKFAVDQLDAKEKDYDCVIILDGDNTVNPDFLSRMNTAYKEDTIAIQAHRRAKNLNTSTAILDALSEEINNSIFRAGHVRLNFSSALIGSGMLFRYNWFKDNVKKLYTAGEDKELEALLLKQGLFVEYLDDVYVYDEKIQLEEAFKYQRRRWLAAQFHTFSIMWRHIPKAIKEKKWDYCDKTFQMLLPPRVISLILIPLIALLISLYSITYSIKWWVLWAVLLIALYIAIPSYMKNKDLFKALLRAPILGIIMFTNLFHLKGASKKFIHTNHG